MTVCHTVSLYIVSYSCNASFQIIREVILNQMEIMMPTEEKEKKNKYVNIKKISAKATAVISIDPATRSHAIPNPGNNLKRSEMAVQCQFGFCFSLILGLRREKRY